MSSSQSSALAVENLLVIDDQARIRKLGSGLAQSPAHALAEWVAQLLAKDACRVEVQLTSSRCTIESFECNFPRQLVDALLQLASADLAVDAHERALASLVDARCLGLVSLLGLDAKRFSFDLPDGCSVAWPANERVPSGNRGTTAQFRLTIESPQFEGKSTAAALLQLCSECGDRLTVNRIRPVSKLAHACFRQVLSAPYVGQVAITQQREPGQIHLCYQGVIFAHLSHPQAPWLSAVLEIPAELVGCSATDMRAHASESFASLLRAAHPLLLAALAHEQQLPAWLHARLLRAAFSPALDADCLAMSHRAAIFASRSAGKPAQRMSMTQLAALVRQDGHERVLDVLEPAARRRERDDERSTAVLSTGERTLVGEILHCRCHVRSYARARRMSWIARIRNFAAHVQATLAWRIDAWRSTPKLPSPKLPETAQEVELARAFTAVAQLPIHFVEGSVPPLLCRHGLFLSRQHPATCDVIARATQRDRAQNLAALTLLLGARGIAAGLYQPEIQRKT